MRNVLPMHGARDHIVRPTFSTAAQGKHSSTTETLCLVFIAFVAAGLMIIGAITSFNWIAAQFQ